jgi:RHS repeat-associated protein
MKWTRHQGGSYDVTVYVDGIFEHYRWDQTTSSAGENYRLHIMDNQSRIAIRRIGAADDAGPAVQYHLGDHLGGSSLVIGGTNATDNALINREEYYPYGETSFGSFSRKRYRFTGKERDEESKLYYHGARYYAPWLARWMSCDPIGSKGGPNPYLYVQGNPLNLVDKSGLYEVAPDTPANRKVPSEVGSTIVNLFEDRTTREQIRGKGFSLRAWLVDREDYMKGAGTGVNVRLRPFGDETKELNYLVPSKNAKVEYFGYTYCVAVTFQYAMLAIEKINRKEHHYGFGKIKDKDYAKLLETQELWYRSAKSLGAPEALVKMGLGYYVQNIEKDLHPGAQINYYGSNQAGSAGGHSLTFLRYDESFSFGKYFSNLFGSKSIKEFFQNLFNFSGAYERTGIVAISQGKEDTYSFNYLRRKAAVAANWLPTKDQVKNDKK